MNRKKLGNEGVAPRSVQATQDDVSAVQIAAEALRKLAIRVGDQGLLGSEEELLLHLGVSRPTFRQAAALVAHEQLIYVKRGPKGGYFASAPDSTAAARMASIYLRFRGANMVELIDAIAPIRVEIAQLATQNQDPEQQQPLREFLELEQNRAPNEVHDYITFLKSERHFGELIADLSGSNVFSLFLNILYDLVAQVARGVDVYAHHEERIEQYQQLRNKMAAAILEGDEELAVLMTKRCSAIVMDWMLEDLRQHERVGASSPTSTLNRTIRLKERQRPGRASRRSRILP